MFSDKEKLLLKSHGQRTPVGQSVGSQSRTRLSYFAFTSLSLLKTQSVTSQPTDHNRPATLKAGTRFLPVGELRRDTCNHHFSTRAAHPGVRVQCSPASLTPLLSHCCCCSVTLSCPALCDPMDGSPPGSSVHGIPQARILEWAAMPSSRGSS